MPHGYAGRTPQQTSPLRGVDNADTDAHMFYDVDAQDGHDTLLAAFLEARDRDVDGQVEECRMIGMTLFPAILFPRWRGTWPLHSCACSSLSRSRS